MFQTVVEVQQRRRGQRILPRQVDTNKATKNPSVSIRGSIVSGLADSISDFFALFKAAPDKTPHAIIETVAKDHGRLEIRRCTLSTNSAASAGASNGRV